MAKYEKPIIVANDDIAEGVYAASGSVQDCWEFTIRPTDNVVPDEGMGKEFQVDGTHTNPEQHLSYPSMRIVFNQNITSAVSTGGTVLVSVNGNVVTVEQNIGTSNPTENLGFAIRVTCGSPETVAVTDFSYTCPN